MPHESVVKKRNWLIAAGVGLLVLGAALIYVSESRHLDEPQPRYMDQLSFNDGGKTDFIFTRIGEPKPPREINPNYGEPTYHERFLRRQTMGWGVASLVLGSVLLVGGWLTKTP